MPTKTSDDIAAHDQLPRTLAAERMGAVRSFEVIEENAAALRAALAFTLDEAEAGKDLSHDLTVVLEWSRRLLDRVECELAAARVRQSRHIKPVTALRDARLATPSALH